MSHLNRLFSAARTLAVATALVLPVFVSFAQHNLPGGGWTYDPGKDGMKDLRALKPIEGCLDPGGLVEITSSDEPGLSSKFWCGTPPYCLTAAALPGNWNCTVVPFSRRNPRGDPNGTPSANPVRNPEDLRCVNTNLPPIAGKCPMPPTVTATLNGQQSLTVQQDTMVTLTVSSPNATVMSQNCSGVNSQFTPVNSVILTALAGQSNATYGPGMPLVVGVTNCTITASNVRGSASTNVALTITARPLPPTVTASFNTTSPIADGPITLSTNTTNATNLVWTCSGRWQHTNESRSVGAITTSHTALGATPGTANCSFTATGPGGTATAAASWTSVDGGGSGGGDGEIIVLPDTYHFQICIRYQAQSSFSCRRTYWYPNARSGNCSYVTATRAPGYQAAVNNARAQHDYEGFGFTIHAYRCTN